MKCFQCNRRKCYTKIVCYDPKWEYAACWEHIKELEKKSDAELGCHNGVMRSHISSTSPVKRELLK